MNSFSKYSYLSPDVGNLILSFVDDSNSLFFKYDSKSLEVITTTFEEIEEDEVAAIDVHCHYQLHVETYDVDRVSQLSLYMSKKRDATFMVIPKVYPDLLINRFQSTMNEFNMFQTPVVKQRIEVLKRQKYNFRFLNKANMVYSLLKDMSSKEFFDPVVAINFNVSGGQAHMSHTVNLPFTLSLHKRLFRYYNLLSVDEMTLMRTGYGNVILATKRRAREFTRRILSRINRSNTELICLVNAKLIEMGLGFMEMFLIVIDAFSVQKSCVVHHAWDILTDFDLSTVGRRAIV